MGKPEIWQDDTPLPEDIRDKENKVIFQKGSLIIWHPLVVEKMNWEQAKKYCSEQGLVLPPIEIFKFSEANGFRHDIQKKDLVPGLYNLYWSSSRAGDSIDAYSQYFEYFFLC